MPGFLYLMVTDVWWLDFFATVENTRILFLSSDHFIKWMFSIVDWRSVNSSYNCGGFLENVTYLLELLFTCTHVIFLLMKFPYISVIHFVSYVQCLYFCNLFWSILKPKLVCYNYSALYTGLFFLAVSGTLSYVECSYAFIW